MGGILTDLVLFPNIASYNAWEARQRSNLGIPFFPTNKLTGLIRTDLPQTIAYSRPIPNPDVANLEVVAFFERNVDNVGETIITQNEAKSQGFFKRANQAFGNLLVTVPGPQQIINDVFVKINQFDQSNLTENVIVDIANGTITLQEAGDYDLSYEIAFAGTPAVLYDLALFVNDVEIRGSRLTTEFAAGRKIGIDSSLTAAIGDVIDWRIKTQSGTGNLFLAQKAQLVVEGSRID